MANPTSCVFNQWSSFSFSSGHMLACLLLKKRFQLDILCLTHTQKESHQWESSSIVWSQLASCYHPMLACDLCLHGKHRVPVWTSPNMEIEPCSPELGHQLFYNIATVHPSISLLLSKSWFSVKHLSKRKEIIGIYSFWLFVSIKLFLNICFKYL